MSNEIKRHEAQEIEGAEYAVAPESEEERLGGLPQSALAVITHKHDVGLFNLPDNTKVPHLPPSMILRIAGGKDGEKLRRNFTKPYVEGQFQAPDCYTVDGDNGSRDRELSKPIRLHSEKDGDAKPHPVFGTCSDCFFRKFGSSGSLLGTHRKGQQCGEYLLIFLLFENREIAVLQVPPTSLNAIPQQIRQATSANGMVGLYNVWWQFHGQGYKGPKQKNADSILVNVRRFATPDQHEHAKALRVRIREDMDKFVLSWASGGLYEESCGGGSAPEEEEVTETPFDAEDMM